MAKTKTACLDLLNEAADLTSGDRQQTHGDKYDNHKNIARIWSVILNIEIEPYQVALCMAGLKLARVSRDGGAGLRDNYADGAAYWGVAWECYTNGMLDS